MIIMYLRKIKEEKKLACPKCNAKLNVSGYPGEKKIIICPKCKTKGYFKFQEEKMMSKIMRLSFFSIPHILLIFLVLYPFTLYPYFEKLFYFIFPILAIIIILLKHDIRILIYYSIFLLFFSNFIQSIFSVTTGEKLALISILLIFLAFFLLIFRLLLEKINLIKLIDL